MPATDLGAVDQVVVDERRQVHELDRDAGRERRRPVAAREEDQQRPQALAAGGKRLDSDGRHQPAAAADGELEPLLELLHVGGQPRRLANRGEAHAATPVWSATIPPAKVR